MSLPALIMAAFGWLALACSQAKGEPVKILWLVAQGGTHLGEFATIADVLHETGVAVEIEFREIKSPDPESFLIAAKRAMAGAEDTIVFGLTLQGVHALHNAGMLASMSRDGIEGRRSRSLYIGSSRTRTAPEPDAIVAVPLAVAAPMLCYNRERLGSLSDFRPSIEEIAWGKLTDRVAVPDPRLDPVGRSVLLSIVEAAGGLSEAWSLMDEFDRSVEVYSSSGNDACRAVADGRADLGFTSVQNAGNFGTRGANVDFQILDRGALVAVSFAAALDTSGQGPREEVARILRWIVGEHLERKLQELEQMLASQGVDFDARERAEAKGVFEFVPIEELVSEWSARYDYRAVRSRR